VLVISQVWGLTEEGDYQQAAIQAADRALELDPNLSLPYAVRGMAHSNRIALGKGGSWDEAIKNLDEAIVRDPKNATAFLWRANNLLTLGYLERAREALEQCLSIDPAYETCRRNLAHIELYTGAVDEALRRYEVGLAQNYANDDVYFARPVAARGDRIGALGVLQVQFHSQPQLLQALFRAITDPAFSATDREQALTLVDSIKDDQAAARGALWVLRDYDRMQQYFTDTPVEIWARGDADWLKSQARRRLIDSLRLPEYWRAQGFPPQCKPVGAADFACP
jgi:tetratricopeptide (TPR) repeat protein